MSAPDQPKAYVRLIDPAVDDLRAILRSDPQIVRQVLKKLLLLERNPEAGNPLLGDLIGWRKLVVGDRHWRVVWRVTTDEGHPVVEIAEVWAAGARSDNEIYDEMRTRVEQLPSSPASTTLAEVIGTLSKAAGAVTATPEPDRREPVPSWLADRLRRQVGLTSDEIDALDPEEGMSLWEQHITRLR